ncbi:hypothetical protein, partial [Sphingomonas sp. Leaf16]
LGSGPIKWLRDWRRIDSLSAEVPG